MSGGVIFARLITIANIFASGTNICMSMSRLQAFENRLSVMSEHIEHMESNQFVLENNINLLFEKNEFMGVRQNILVDYMNSLSAMHACDVLHLNFDTQLVRMEQHLDDILSAIYSGKFDHSLVNLGELHLMTGQSFFSDTIFRISPSLLYRYSRSEIVSLTNNKLTIMVNFPRISREFEFDYVNLIQAPKRIESDQMERFLSFLIPHGLNLSLIDEHIDEMRSTQYCLSHEQFKACPNTALNSRCLKSIIINDRTVLNDSCLQSKIPIDQYSLQYFDSGALIFFAAWNSS